MAEDPGIDQETFDRLVAEGQPERVARAKAKAAAARKSRQAEASTAADDTGGATGDGATGGATGGGETPEQVQERVFNELVAQGQPERVARAKAKAAAARAERSADAKPQPARQPAATAARTGGGAPGGGTAVTTGNGAGNGAALTPEQRQARVAAALAARTEGGPHARTGGVETKYAGQEHTHRLLALVPPTGIQQIRGKQDDKAYTWPHLITAEFVCLMALTVALTVFSAFAPAPLRELANPNVTPNPSKAPWYFLGLQELLRYWHPMVAGVTIPLIIGPLGLIAIPYLDRNPSVRPENRRFAYALFTLFLVASSVLTISGSFFRGPGFNWTWPWFDGIWFTL